MFNSPSTPPSSTSTRELGHDTDGPPPAEIDLHGACNCWISPVTGHDGHCCFDHYDPTANRVTCGHDDVGMTALEALR